MCNRTVEYYSFDAWVPFPGRQSLILNISPWPTHMKLKELFEEPIVWKHELHTTSLISIKVRVKLAKFS